MSALLLLATSSLLTTSLSYTPRAVFRVGCTSRVSRLRLAAVAEDLVPGEDLYSILGVARDATTAEIRKVVTARAPCNSRACPLTAHNDPILVQAYRQQARLLHPDVSSANDATSKFRRLSAAYEILVSPRRAEWHAAAKRGGQGWPAPAPSPRPRSSTAHSAGRWDWVAPVCLPWVLWWLFLYLVRL